MSDNQAHSPLFEIPGEVREIIYSFALAFRYGDFEFSSRPLYAFVGQPAFARPLPALMLTCKRAYSELRARVQEEAVLRACMFEHGRRIGLAVHGTLSIPRLRRLVFHVAMEHANWNTWVQFFAHVLESAAGLRELVIDWEPRRSSSAGRIGFMAQHEDRMEKRLFKAVAGARHLESLRIHGDTVPAHWAEKLGQMLGGQVRMVFVKEKWWREGWESGMNILDEAPRSRSCHGTVGEMRCQHGPRVPQEPGMIRVTSPWNAYGDAGSVKR